MNLRDSPLGIKRRLKTVGILQWNHPDKFLIVIFEIECINSQGELLTDKSILQNREVRYVLNNQNRVNAQFNPVQSGGSGEYDYFFNIVENTPLPQVLSQLATKLNERLIFD